ncbi:MAG TPA: hypothetical protein VGJ37_00450 [Pyrinomonadaceae bacterium]|jgi:hypothetical protein
MMIQAQTFMRRRLLLIILVSYLPFLSGCSFSTDYVIVNSSPAPVRVTYLIGRSGIDPLTATGVNVPAMLPVAELTERQWRKLSSGDFEYDPSTHVVSVLLPPNRGLLIARGGDYRPDAPTDNFIIREIHIVGAGGELVLKDSAVPKAFVVVPKPFYAFGPPTLLKLTYT